MAREFRSCARCAKMKHGGHFEDVEERTPWCRQCMLQRALARQQCSNCRKTKPWKQFPLEEQVGFEADPQGKLPTCFLCHPDFGPHACSICHGTKARGQFLASTLLKSFSSSDKLRLLRCNPERRLGLGLQGATERLTAAWAMAITWPCPLPTKQSSIAY